MEIHGLMIAAAFCAYLVKGLCGFANTLVFTSILSFHSASINITPVDLLVSIPANILMVIRERKSIRMKVWLPLAAMVVGGSIPGVFLLKFGDVSFLKLILGSASMGIGIEMLLREYQTKKRKSSPVMLFIIGIVSGLLCGMFGIGALLAAYIGRTTETTGEFRGNLNMVFLADNVCRLIVYSTTGIITWNVVKTALTLFPFALLGLGAGMLLTRVADEKLMKKIVIVMLIISGAALFLTNLF